MSSWSLPLIAVMTSFVLGIVLFRLYRRVHLVSHQKPPPPTDCVLRALVSTFSSLIAWGYGPALDALGTTYGIDRLSRLRDAPVVRDRICVGEIGPLIDDLDQLYRAALAAHRTTA